jgi:hypothetical protein
MLGFVGHIHTQDWRSERQPAAAAVCMPTLKAVALESGKRFDSRYINTGSERAGGESL